MVPVSAQFEFALRYKYPIRIKILFEIEMYENLTVENCKKWVTVWSTHLI